MANVNHSSSKIYVEGDYTIGDISGQIAIGENIKQTQIFYTNCIFIYPDGRSVKGKSWLYTQSIRPSTNPNDIFGRQQELIKIDEFLNDRPALAIIGLRGIGKSTLASLYIDRIEKKEDFAGIFWYKVDENTDISDLVNNFLTVAGKSIKNLEDYREVDQLDILFRELKAAPYLLVIDNFEVLLDPQTNKPLKSSFSDFIEKSIEITGKSRVIFTSWESPASERGIRPELYHIGGLDDLAAIQLFKKNGLIEQDNNIQKVKKLCGGHPLALILLIQLIKGGGETLSTVLDDNALWIGEEGEVAERILDKVYKERLDKRQRKLLQYFSLFSEPTNSKAIASVVNDPLWTEVIIKKIALNLIRKSLLRKIGESYWEESLIQNYSYIKLNQKDKYHLLACQYFLSLSIPKCSKIEDFQPLIEAYHHACKAKKYDLASIILLETNLIQDLSTWGYFEKLIELYNKVLPEDHLDDKPLLKSLKTHSTILGNIGRAYRHMGRTLEAIQYLEKALKISQKIEDKQNESICLGSLGIAYGDLGETKKALQFGIKALEISQEIGDKKNEEVWLGNLGLSYREFGKAEKAIQCFEKALKLSQEIGDRRNEGIWNGNLGETYDKIGELNKAILYFKNALKISEELQDRRNTSGWLAGVGNVYIKLYEEEIAIEFLEKALEIAQELKDKRAEGICFLRIGSAHFSLENKEKAIENYRIALKINQNIRDKRGEGACFANIGNIYSKFGDSKMAIKHYKKALEISEEIEDNMLEDYILRNISEIYGMLGETDKVIEYYEKALNKSQKTEDKKSEIQWLGKIGNAYILLKNFGIAIQYYKKALKNSQELGDKSNECLFLGNIGVAYSNKKAINEAIGYYSKSIIISQEIGNMLSECLGLCNLGIILGYKEKYRDAMACYLLAEDICFQINDPYINNIEMSINDIKNKIGENEFEKILKEVNPKLDKIVEEILSDT